MAHLKAKGRKMPILGIRLLIKHHLADEVCHKCQEHRSGTWGARIHCDDIS
jgi:hypothetical protein